MKEPKTPVYWPPQKGPLAQLGHASCRARIPGHNVKYRTQVFEVHMHEAQARCHTSQSDHYFGFVSTLDRVAYVGVRCAIGVLPLGAAGWTESQVVLFELAGCR